MKIDGRWEGKLLDCSGVAASVVLHLAQKSGKVSGDFSVSFLEADGSCCARGGANDGVTHSGPVEGRILAKTRAVELKYAVTIGLAPVRVRFSATIEDAYPYAARALIGEYRADSASYLLTLEGGVCLVWQLGGRGKG